MHETIIYFSAGATEFQIVLERFKELPLQNIRKIFRLLFSEKWNDNNREAIDTLYTWLPDAIKQAKANWGAATAEFSDGWRNLKFFAAELASSDQKRAIVSQRKLNRSLTAALKKAKTAYDRLVKIQSIFNEEQGKPRRFYR